jgi:NAD(P)H-nitrite reductase large subunit
MLKTLRVISQRIALYPFNEYNNAMGPKKKSEIICRCNNVSKETIEKAIKNGAHTLNEIFDATSAGVGPCGGTCRRKLGPLLDYYLSNGIFPEKIIEDLTGKPSQPKKPTSS